MNDFPGNHYPDAAAKNEAHTQQGPDAQWLHAGGGINAAQASYPHAHLATQLRDYAGQFVDGSIRDMLIRAADTISDRNHELANHRAECEEYRCRIDNLIARIHMAQFALIAEKPPS